MHNSAIKHCTHLAIACQLCPALLALWQLLMSGVTASIEGALPQRPYYSKESILIVDNANASVSMGFTVLFRICSDIWHGSVLHA